MFVLTAEGLEAAQKCTDVLFNKNLATLHTMSESELQQLTSNVPVVHGVLDPGTTVLDACVRAKCARNEGERPSASLSLPGAESA